MSAGVTDADLARIVECAVVLLGILSSFGLYHLLTAFRWRRRPAQRAQASEAPHVTFLLTAYREGDGVRECLDALFALEHPAEKLHVIVVADEDPEGTAAAARAFALQRRGIAGRNAEGDEVIEGDGITAILQRGERAARGKPRALQNALRYARGDGFIGVMDGDHVIEPDFLVKTLPLFDEDVGIVQARRWAKVVDATWLTTWDVFEQNVGQVQNQLSRGSFGCASFYGSTGIIRAELLKRLGWENSLAEDTHLNYDVRELGYRVVFTTDTGSREDHVTRVRHYVRQRRRWAAGHTQVLAAKMRLIARSPLGPIARLEACYHLLYYMMAAVLLQYWLLRAAYYWAQAPPVPLLPIAGASILLGVAGAMLEGLVDPRPRARAHAFLVSGAIAFALLSIAISFVRPAPEAFPVPVGLETALFLAPMVGVAAGYANGAIRPRAGPRAFLTHARRWCVILLAAIPMLVVNLYATLTGMLLSTETKAPWVKTTRRGSSC